MPVEAKARPPLELWGGIECTVNRVGDCYLDQVNLTGHGRRPSDLDRVAALGLRTLRYPLLWERIDPAGSGRPDWRWADARMARLQALGIRPVVGLVHHGSGPPHTSLTDPAFADGLAAHAGCVARRYPWVADYTPVNEPLTTARFSGLYGHWYPHGRDDRTFVTALLTQCRAVVLAMRAVRAVRPDARLVQTDDLGHTHAPPALQYQADFENERRWLTWDLLAGRVGRSHPMWGYLLSAGAAEHDVAWFRDNPCPPDVLGVNHYLTSERYLDDRIELHAAYGGNGRHAYADVEAVRVCRELAGPAALFRAAWERYRLPVAVTEAHLGCTREEQARWLLDIWRAADAVRAAGADVRAVTVWALFGSCDWDGLVTRPAGRYEPGAFDARCDPPRATAVAEVVRALAAGREPAVPHLDVPGWWRRPERVLYPLDDAHHVPAVPAEPGDGWNAAPGPVLIAGATGTLGRAFGRACEARGLPYRLLARGDMDVANPASVAAALVEFAPWAVVNAAGYVRVDEAEGDADRCFRENVVGPAVLAEACAARGVGLVTFSSDLVFDGRRRRPYRETDAPSPLCVYGRSKATAERLVLARHPGALVVRTAAFFGPWDGHNFVAHALRALRAGQAFLATEDQVVSPTYTPDLAHATLDLLLDGEVGVWHLANGGAVSWANFAREAARRAGLRAEAVFGQSAALLGWPARRPAFSALGSVRGRLLPPWGDALDRYFRECDAGHSAVTLSAGGPP